MRIECWSLIEVRWFPSWFCCLALPCIECTAPLWACEMNSNLRSLMCMPLALLLMRER